MTPPLTETAALAWLRARLADPETRFIRTEPLLAADIQVTEALFTHHLEQFYLLAADAFYRDLAPLQVPEMATLKSRPA